MPSQSALLARYWLKTRETCFLDPFLAKKDGNNNAGEMPRENAENDPLLTRHCFGSLKMSCLLGGILQPDLGGETRDEEALPPTRTKGGSGYNNNLLG